MKIEKSDRLKVLPPYPFVQIDNMKKAAIKKGIDIIDLGVGNPDMPTFKNIVNKMKESVNVHLNHKYPQSIGSLKFRTAAAKWMLLRFNVKADPNSEVVSLIGSKEGLAHISLAYVNPGDFVLVPDPGYPVYKISAIFSGGKPYTMPLLEKNKWLVDVKNIPLKILKKTKIMFLNYPNNPTGAEATTAFFKGIVMLAKKYNFIICHDTAYSEIYYNNKKPISILEIAGAKDVAIEMHSLSKTYNMAGWRIGFAVGNKNIVSGLASIKSNIDSGVFQAVQDSAISAFTTPYEVSKKMRNIYRERMEMLSDAVNDLGWNAKKSSSTFYLWIKIPKKFKMSSSEFAGYVIDKCGIVITPGTAFGKYGEGYFRMSVTVATDRIKEAVSRLKACM